MKKHRQTAKTPHVINPLLVILVVGVAVLTLAVAALVSPRFLKTELVETELAAPGDFEGLTEEYLQDAFAVQAAADAPSFQIVNDQVSDRLLTYLSVRFRIPNRTEADLAGTDLRLYLTNESPPGSSTFRDRLLPVGFQMKEKENLGRRFVDVTLHYLSPASEQRLVVQLSLSDGRTRQTIERTHPVPTLKELPEVTAEEFERQ